VIRTAGVLGSGAVLGGAFYLLLVDTTSTPELYVLCATAIACAIALGISREQQYVEASIRPSWLLASWRVLVEIAPNVLVLCAEALAQLARPRRTRGTFRAVPFQATARTTQDTGRRALTEWLGSLAPNTIVVGVDDERGLLLVHQLRRQGDPEQVDPMGLG
jgi:multisubunit Na+/H+ antiporter MnhE subunit